ncbi:Gmad2 immunoglobulin-like domain-containing protein [Nocardioides sp. AX2bis]|uniref:Gmad2 immunoglobulin-like domain-containing protein n=1 Tax=Nocardioides sp. AX2bis TaxID=2653157 RepID=UPI0013583FFD|nr:Gmad2 immunoglobulin-like domain-containing protein [Nocardioides sp. AX2bis]
MWSLSAAPHRRHRRHRAVALGLAGGLSLAALAGCGDDAAENAEDPGSTSSDEASATPSDDAEPSEEASATPTDEPTEETEEPTSTTTVPVYVVGDTPQGQRLFREFRSVEASDPLVAAGEMLTGGSTLDPDYDSLLPTGSFTDVRQGEDGFEVVLEDASWTERPDGMTAAQAALAVQQVVYTLQGVAQERQPLRAFTEDGGEATTLFGVPTANGVKAAPQLQTLGLVNVTMPEEATVVKDSFTATGVASSFEGTVPWEVRSGGEVVQDGFATADGYLDRLYPWSAEVDVSDLDPGTYTFVAMTSDPSGGEGAGPTEDTKTIRVE